MKEDLMDLFEDAHVICSYSALDAEDDGILKRQPSWRNGLGLDAPRFASIGAVEALSAPEIADLFARYSREDWGRGECGFASYPVAGETVWLIDESTRSPEGLAPAVEPGAALGPQTLILSSEY